MLQEFLDGLAVGVLGLAPLGVAEVEGVGAPVLQHHLELDLLLAVGRDLLSCEEGTSFTRIEYQIEYPWNFEYELNIKSNILGILNTNHISLKFLILNDVEMSS